MPELLPAHRAELHVGRVDGEQDTFSVTSDKAAHSSDAQVPIVRPDFLVLIIMKGDPLDLLPVHGVP